MAITKEKAIEILEKFDFFQGQRAGRELWNDKPRHVQEIDLKDFRVDVALLREYIANVAPKSEGEWIRSEFDDNARCSICGAEPHDFKWPIQNPDECQYCPCCGAHMLGVNYGWFETWDEIKKDGYWY